MTFNTIAVWATGEWAYMENVTDTILELHPYDTIFRVPKHITPATIEHMVAEYIKHDFFSASVH